MPDIAEFTAAVIDQMGYPPHGAPIEAVAFGIDLTSSHGLRPIDAAAVVSVLCASNSERMTAQPPYSIRQADGVVSIDVAP